VGCKKTRNNQYPQEEKKPEQEKYKMCDGKCVSEKERKQLVINGKSSIFSGEAKNFSTFHEL
jgi:hypothetical protein